MCEAEDILIVDHAEDILIAPDSRTGPRGLSTGLVRPPRRTADAVDRRSGHTYGVALCGAIPYHLLITRVSLQLDTP